MPFYEKQRFSLKRHVLRTGSRGSLRDTCLQKQLLQTVQLAKLYKDSKHFVDMPLKFSSEVVELRFEQLMNETNGEPKKHQLEQFINENFDEPGSDCIRHEPEDWREHPKFLDGIEDNRLRDWAEHLNEYWKILCLKVSNDVKENPSRHTLIPVHNPMIVPGDRFREFYYWDSYWTMKGLLLSEMTLTARGMIENYFAMVDAYGKVPNGGRQYYAHRSQPPYLIPMMKLYMENTNDDDFLRNNIDVLEKEFDFWRYQRSVHVEYKGKTYRMIHYNVEVGDPRPESLYEDIDTASVYETDAEKQQMYMELRTGTESGWDFSSRWYIKDGTNEGELCDSKPRYIIPVDLNSLFCLNARILSSFYSKLGDEDKADEFKREADSHDEAINTVLWDDDSGVWFDFDITNEIRRPYFYLSNFYPLWTHSYFSVKNKDEMLQKVLHYLRNSGGLDYPGGVPTSLRYSGQQWDFPNAWAPLQHMLIEGLESVDLKEYKDLAFNLAQRWISTVFRAYEETGSMFEKYNMETGARGMGGEYQVQLGFGWTNGVSLDLLNTYGDRLRSDSVTNMECNHIKGFVRAKSLWLLWACCASAFGTVNICYCSRKKSSASQ